MRSSMAGMTRFFSNLRGRRTQADLLNALVTGIVLVFCIILIALIIAVVATIWMHRGFYGLPILPSGRNAHGETNVDRLFDFIYALAVFVGFGATVIQLRRAHLDKVAEDKWQRARFVAQEFRLFNSDRSVLNFKAILETVSFDFPRRLQLEVVDPHDLESTKTAAPQLVELSITLQQLMNAFTPDHHEHLTDVETDRPLPGPVRWSPVEMKIVTEIDQFMNYMIGFSKLHRQGILEIEDLHGHLYYWLDIIFPEESRMSQFPPRTQILRRQLQRYLKVYYNGQTPDRWDEGQCAFISTILAVRTERTAKSGASNESRCYENTFGKVDIDPAWKGS